MGPQAESEIVPLGEGAPVNRIDRALLDLQRYASEIGAIVFMAGAAAAAILFGG